jgi:NUDIX domain
MKARATIICSRDGKVLLVARTRSRWSLPGGTIKPSESPLDAARREWKKRLRSSVRSSRTCSNLVASTNDISFFPSVLLRARHPNRVTKFRSVGGSAQRKYRRSSPVFRPAKSSIFFARTRIAVKRRRLSSTNETGQLPLMSLTASQQDQFKLSRGNS